MRRAETKLGDGDRKKPDYEKDKWDYDNSSHLERVVSRYKVPNIYTHKVSTNGEPAALLPTRTNNQIKNNAKETLGGDLVLQNCRYKTINNRVYRVPGNPIHVDMTSASTDGGSKKALAGLIFMSNDKVRRSSFKYGVLGMPIAKKPILDRVEPGTKLFLFEFEARVLWGIFEATSEASLDIAKDAYRGSEVPFPSQVKFRVYKQCRPLPERIFQPAIEDNYFTPTKFNFELTEQQVSKLTKLYSLRESNSLSVEGRAFSAAQNNIPHETDAVRGDGRAISAVAQDDNPYEIDRVQVGVQVDGRAISAAQSSIPYVARLQDGGRLDDLPNAREELVKSGNAAAGNLVGSRYIGNDKHDTFKSASMNCKDYPIPNREENFQDTIQGDLTGGPASRSNTYAGTKPLLSEARVRNINLYFAKDEIISEDDLRHQTCKSELPQHAGDSTYEPRRQGMIDYLRDSSVRVVDLPDTELEPKRSLEGPLEEEYRLYKLKMKHLNDSVPSRQLLSSSDEHDKSESSGYLRPGDGSPSYNEAMDMEWATKEVLKLCSTTHKPAPTATTYPVKVCDDDHEMHARKTLDFLPLLESSYLTPVLVKSSTHPRTSTVPDDEAWLGNHGHIVESFATRSEASTQPRTSTVLDDEAWLGNNSRAAKSFSTRSNTVQDNAKARVENTPCVSKSYTARSNNIESDDKAWVENPTHVAHVAKSYTTRSKTVENDDKARVGSTKRVANSFVPQSFKVEDDEAWLEKARRVVVNSVIARSNNYVEDAYKKGEQIPPVQVENQARRSHLRILGKQPRFSGVSSLPAGNDNGKPRRSVWSRLSTPRRTLNSGQTSKELVLPKEDLGDFQLSRGSLPWKRRVSSIRTYQKHRTDYEVGGKVSDMGEFLGIDEKELNFDFKRRKSILSKTDPSSKPDHAWASAVLNKQMAMVMKGNSNPSADDYDNQRDTRRIKRPLLTSGKQSMYQKTSV